MDKGKYLDQALHVSQVKVRFFDTDLSGAVFFANFIKWFDSIAVIDYLKEKGVDWISLNQENVDAVMVNVNFDFIAPLYLDNIVDITIEEVLPGNKSIKISGSLYKNDTGAIVARCSAVYVFVNNSTRDSIAIPASILEKLS